MDIVNNKQIEIKTIEMHNCGQPLRIIETGYPVIQGKTILNKQAYCKETLDNYRKLIVFEPRGHAGLIAVLLVEPDDVDADVAILLLDNVGYISMCGDATITISRYAIDKGIIPNPTSPETKVSLQLPCGLVESYVEYSSGKTGKVRFQTVPAFVFELDVAVEVEGYGKVEVDVAYGGMFYAVVQTQAFGIKCFNGNIEKLIQIGNKVQVRSPCGSGTTARVAVQHARGQINKGQCRSFVSGISGCTFTGKVQEVTKCGAYDAVIVEICGQGSRYMGTATYTLEEHDEFPQGLLVN